MQTLVGDVVENETVVMINAAEVLDRDGIHGKISSVGKGFGTGRHTMYRKSPT
jgi:hypothetical protein